MSIRQWPVSHWPFNAVTGVYHHTSLYVMASTLVSRHAPYCRHYFWFYEEYAILISIVTATRPTSLNIERQLSGHRIHVYFTPRLHHHVNRYTLTTTPIMSLHAAVGHFVNSHLVSAE